jgi:hypothetical protein
MSVRMGSCGICKKQKTELEEHHVVEYLDEKGRTPKIYICDMCHGNQENYKNYLKNVVGIDIDRKNQN